MKKKLFENVGGNRFKLITESVIEANPKSALVREGLKKVFTSGEKELSYRRLENVGLGYIKNVNEAKKCAVEEARELAKEYGYTEHENTQTFVKEDETNLGDPKEARDVQIGREIIKLCQGTDANFPEIIELAKELIALHTGEAITKPGTGGASYKAGSVY